MNRPAHQSCATCEHFMPYRPGDRKISRLAGEDYGRCGLRSISFPATLEERAPTDWCDQHKGR